MFKVAMEKKVENSDFHFTEDDQELVEAYEQDLKENE
jgi:hypothetical protein